jgi:ribosomal-protein-alanine N-acetyltransferase
MAQTQMQPIKTQRLLLRWFEMSDLDDLHGIFSLPQVMRFSLTGPYSIEQTRESLNKTLANYAKDGFGTFAVIHQADKSLIGYCGFYRQQIDGVDEIEIGYRLHPDYWGQGLATEAARAVRDYAFDTLGFNRLISIIEPENLGSIRVAEKNGFRLEKQTRFKDEVPVGIYSIEQG